MAETQESLHFLDYWRVISSRKEVVLAVSLLVVATGVIFTYSMPKVYQSSVVIQVKEETPDVAIFQQEMMRYDPLFLRTQFEIIQSGPIIEEVVRRLNLAERLAKAIPEIAAMNREEAFAQTVKIVTRSMRVQQFRDTNLIEIQMYLSEPEDTAPQVSAELSNMIAEVYRDQSMSRTRNVTERALKALFQSLEEQKLRVEEVEGRVKSVREKYRISMITPFVTSESTGTLAKETMRLLEAARIRTRLDLEGKKARYEKCLKLSAEELLAAFPWLAHDAALSALVAEKIEAEIKKNELLKANYGPRHPEVEKTSTIIDELQRKIDDALRGLKIGMQHDYEAEQAKSTALEQMVAEAQEDEITSEGEGYREFEEAVAELEHAKRIRDALEVRYFQEKIELRIPRTAVEIIEPAKSPDTDDPVSPNFLLNVILSIIVGLGSGVGLAYFIEYLDTSVKTIEDIERYLDLTVLGVIPQKVKPLLEEDADPAHAEAYRVLRTNIKSSQKFVNGSTVCITSGSVGEGKSLTLFNLAYTCATLGEKVLIVDSDLHRPRQHRILGTSNKHGLANVLIGEENVEDNILETKIPNLSFLPSGKLSSGVHGLLDTERMRSLCDDLKEQYSIVFFDAPPIIGVSDASLLVRQMDGVLLVIQHRKYPRALSSRAKAMVENMGANLLGVVLNNINISRDYSSYYYQQHYYSYPHRSRPGQTGETRA
jgi:polysaccharide biosynthesis transport protein